MGDFQSVQLTVTGCQFCCQRNKEKIYFQGRAAHSNELFRQNEWKSLWDLKVPSKIKVFCPLQVFSREEIRQTHLNVKFVVLMKIHGSMHCYDVPCRGVFGL